MQLKIGLNLIRNYSYNFSTPKRGKKFIKFIIIHYTGMKKEADAIKKLCDPRSKVSSHYLIKNNGEILNLVPDLFEAWHSGKSRWGKLELLNKYSIGIEISNPGHDHLYRKFKEDQIHSLFFLLRYLIKKYKINNKNILGHSDIAPLRKIDPGEKFPWKKLAKKKLCIWHDLDEIKIKKFRKKKIVLKDENNFLKNLYKMGYQKINKKNYKKNKFLLVNAFQRRFRQNLINGKIDKECYLISKSLVKS